MALVVTSDTVKVSDGADGNSNDGQVLIVLQW